MSVKVIGAGLAGCECAWQLAMRGIDVELFEMKPLERSPAATSDSFAELVCSNSLRGASLSTAPGLLKEEMRRLGSLIISCADSTQTPAGGALAVDREGFSALVTKKIAECANIKIISGRVDKIPEGTVIIATGPLTDGTLASEISDIFGEQLHFYDAAAPIVSLESIDMDCAYFGSRYDKGTPDYINCPMNKEQYLAFVAELAAAEEAPVHGFEDSAVFEGCMPVEVMARRGTDTLRYGPLKPVGLQDPRSNERHYAVVQLRADDKEGRMYNIVGFQTHLKQPEQRRVFGLIPALRHAEFFRYGVMHRSSFVNAPGKLDGFFRVIGNEHIMLAGQLTGVEGYIESAASGLYCAINLALRMQSKEPLALPISTAIGALSYHVSSTSGGKFKPTNINFGLIPALDQRIKSKQERYALISARSLEIIDKAIENRKGDIIL